MSVRFLILLLLVLGLLACVAIGAIVVAARRRRTAQIGPRCGNCGYNLTGAPSNRCPECGKLFIEAGVITQPPAAPASRRWVGIAFVVFAVFAALGFAGLLLIRVNVQAARNRAVAIQQAAAARAAAAAQAAATQANDAEPVADPGSEADD